MEIPEGKYLGSLCKRGHDWEGTGKSLRYKGNSNCILCAIARAKLYDQENPEKRLLSSRKFTKNHKHEENYKQKNIENSEKYRQNNLQKCRDSCNKYKQDNYEKVEKKAKEWRKNNKIRFSKYIRERKQEIVLNLEDTYVRESLKKSGFKNITPELIEAKRQIILTKRFIKEMP